MSVWTLIARIRSWWRECGSAGNAGLDCVFNSMQCQNVLSTCWPVDLCACIGHLCFRSCGFFGAVVDYVKSRLCLHWVQCCSVLLVWPSYESFFLPPWPPPHPPMPSLFSISVCTFRYCSNCGLSCSLTFLYISICIQYVGVYGCSGDYFHTNADRYLFWFFAWLIQRQVQVSQCLFYPSCVSLWFMHCECVIVKMHIIR